MGSLSGSSPSSQEFLLSISWGRARAVGATVTHMLGLDTQPWIIYQTSRGENPRHRTAPLRQAEQR